MCASSSASGLPGSSGGPGGGGCTSPGDAARATASCSGGHPPAAAASAVDSVVRTPAAVPSASWTPDTAAAVRLAAPGTVAGCGGHHGGQAGHGPAEQGGRPSACVRPCPARMPEAARRWPTGATVQDRVRRRPYGLAGLGWLPHGHPCPRWWPACGQRPDTRPGLRSPRTPAWPRVPDSGRPVAVVSVAADGQSADRSDSLQLSLLFLQGRPCGRPPAALRPATTRRLPGSRPHRSLTLDRELRPIYARWPRAGHARPGGDYPWPPRLVASVKGGPDAQAAVGLVPAHPEGCCPPVTEDGGFQGDGPRVGGCWIQRCRRRSSAHTPRGLRRHHHHRHDPGQRPGQLPQQRDLDGDGMRVDSCPEGEDCDVGMLNRTG